MKEKDFVAQSPRTTASESFFATVGRTVVTLVIVAILAELASVAILIPYRKFHQDPLVPQKSPAYDNETWGRDFWAEQTAFWTQARSSYLPFMVWGVRKWHGKFINTDDTEMGSWRRTIQATTEACKNKPVRKIWVFGGSTVYGIGTPDWATIPSYLARELNTDPTACVEVMNLGAEGYVTNQELILLGQQLKAGRKPDIAIFYDGVNESLVGGYSPGIPTAHWNFEMIRTRVESGKGIDSVLNKSHFFQLVRLILENNRSQAFEKIPPGELAARAQATLNNYEANLKLVRILANAYGVKTLFFWQPVLAWGNKPLVPFEKQLQEARAQELGGQVNAGLRAVYQEAEARSATSRDFVFLGHAFDNVPDMLYVDEFHLDPRGNQIMAHVMAQAVQQEPSTQLSKRSEPLD